MTTPGTPAAASIVSAKISIDISKPSGVTLAPDYANFGEFEIQIRQLMTALGMDAIIFDNAPEDTKSRQDIAAAKIALNNHLPSSIDTSVTLNEMWKFVQAAVPSARDRRIAAIRDIMAMQVFTYSSIAEYKQALDAKLRIIAATSEKLTATEAYTLSTQIVRTLHDYLSDQRSIYENKVAQRVFEDSTDAVKTVTKLLADLMITDMAIKSKINFQNPVSKSGPVANAGVAPKASSSAFSATTATSKPGKGRNKKNKGESKHQGRDRRGDHLGRREDSSHRISKTTGDKSTVPCLPCHYCGHIGHKLSECRNKAKNDERKAVNLQKLREEVAMPAQVEKVARPEPTFTFINTTGSATKQGGHEHYSVYPAREVNDGEHQHQDDHDRRILLDTGATITIFNTEAPFDALNPSNHKVQGVAGEPIAATGEGAAAIMISGHLIEIQRALYVPEAKLNLLAAKDLKPLRYAITHDGILVGQPGSQTLISWVNGNMFYLEFYSPVRVSVAVLPSTHPWCLWHRRLGHPSPSTMEAMRRAGYPVPASPPDLASNPLKYCETCPLAKLVKASLRQPTVIDPQYTAGSRWNIDTLGPFTPLDINGNRYVLVIADHATRRYSVHLMPSRDVTFRQIAAQYEWQISHQPGMTLREIRLDNAKEFMSTVFRTWAESRGINLTYPPTHSPAHNPVAERAVSAVTTVMRSLLFQSNLPAAYWGYAVLQGVP